MRILYIAPLNSIHSRRWIGFFHRQGYEVHVIDPYASASDAHLEGVQIHVIPVTGLQIPLLKYLTRIRPFIAKVKQLVQEIQPDIIHIHWIGLHAYAGASIGFHPLMVTPWGSDLLVLPKESTKRMMILKRVLMNADVFTCDADHVKRELQRYGIPPEIIHIVFFGTDVEKFNPGRRDTRLTTELGFPVDSKLIISLRSLEKLYDIPTFIKAAATVLESRPEARFIVVGGGPERENLIGLSKSLGISEQIRFTGRLSDDDMIRYTASSDVYVSSSLSDAGLAASTAEAMACGVPAIITDFGDNAKWVEHGDAGLLFPAGDHAALAQHIISLLSDTDRAMELGQQGRRVIEERNSFSREMMKIDALYHAAVGSKRTN